MASDAAGNVTVHLALSCLPPFPGAILHQDAHALCLWVERPVVAERPVAAPGRGELRGAGGGEDGAPRQGGGGGATCGQGGVCRQAGLTCRAAWCTRWTDPASGQPPPHACREEQRPRFQC